MRVDRVAESIVSSSLSFAISPSLPPARATITPRLWLARFPSSSSSLSLGSARAAVASARQLFAKTPKALHAMLTQMFGELTLLGFIGILLFIVEMLKPIEELSDKVRNHT